MVAAVDKVLGGYRELDEGSSRGFGVVRFRTADDEQIRVRDLLREVHRILL